MSQSPAGIDRRTLLQRVGLTALIAGPGATLLSACATSSSKKKDDVKANNADAKNPFGVKANAALDVVIFMGGYKDGYATQGHEPLYKKEFPAATVKHEAITAIGTTLQPRFNSGTNIPDVVDNSGTGQMDWTALAGAGQLQDLTALWNAPSVDDPSKKVRDTVLAGTIETGMVAGKPYQMNYVATTFGLWYNKKLFADNGWTAPKTWAEFTALCDKIKAKGIVPFAYAGKNAAYYMFYGIIQSANKIGGNQVGVDVDNLAPGAWSNAAVKTAATNWGQICKKYSDPAYQGLIHTQVQTLHKQNKIAFYPSGDWLENEMKDVKGADGFEYAVCPYPDMGGDKIPYPALRVSAGEPFFASAKGANPAGALEYLRQMLSKAGAQAFFKQAGSMSVVQGALEGMTLSPGTSSVVAAQKAAGSSIITYLNFDGWYKDLDMEARNQTNKLCYGGGNADSFCSALDKEAAKIKGDSSITKQTRPAIS
jgi:N-acetylglucosamine transport system substrate-binding protein